MYAHCSANADLQGGASERLLCRWHQTFNLMKTCELGRNRWFLVDQPLFGWQCGKMARSKVPIGEGHISGVE